MKKNYFFNKNKGVSLIEMLIYVSFFGVLSILIINTLFVVTKVSAKARINYSLADGGAGAIESITRLIRNADTLDQFLSVFGSDSGVLSISYQNDSGSTILDKIYLSGTTVKLDENGVYVGDLTNTKIQVSKLLFQNINTTNSKAIKIEMVVKDSRDGDIKTADFYNTVILKKKY